MTIKNDQDFKKALSELSVQEQRLVATQFIKSVLLLNSDPVIERALQIVEDEKSSQSEFDDVYKSLKTLAVKTYTACGDDADWASQAAHFVVTAAKACLTPLGQLDNKKNLAWKCAMQTRMARSCAMIETQSDIVDNEAQKQYAIINNVID